MNDREKEDDMSLDPLARLKALLRERIRKIIAMERAQALEAEREAAQESTRHTSQAKSDAQA